MRAAFIFGRGIICGGAFEQSGRLIPVTTCLFYQCWEVFDVDYNSFSYDYYDSNKGESNEDKITDVGYILLHDLPAKILWQGDNIIRQHHRDIYWWHTGGFSKFNLHA